MDIGNINNQLQNNFERFSSGKRINSSKDDAAGQAIANRLRSQETEQQVRQRNFGDIQSRNSVASGALRGVSGTLQNLRELSVQAGNDSLNPQDRQFIQDQAGRLLEELGSVSGGTNFNGQNLLGDGGQLDVSAGGLGIAGLDLTSTAGAGDALDKIDEAFSRVSSLESRLGAGSNAVDSSIESSRNLEISTASARSRIEDADLAKLAEEKGRLDVLREAGIKVMKTKNEQEKSKLSLIA